MKKNKTTRQSSKQGARGVKNDKGWITIGLDLGDKTSRCCAIEQSGEAWGTALGKAP